MIRIFVGEEKPLLCAGLTRDFKETKGFEVSGFSYRGYDAWKQISDDAPDVALLDLSLPGLTAIEIAERIAKRELVVKVIVFANPNQTDYSIRRALAADISGYVIKTIEWPDLLKTVRQVAKGEFVMGQGPSAELRDELRRDTKSENGKLSNREQSVLGLMSIGETAAQIAGDLSLTTSTIRGHIEQIYKKLNVRNAPAAVGEGIRKGLIK